MRRSGGVLKFFISEKIEIKSVRFISNKSLDLGQMVFRLGNLT